MNMIERTQHGWLQLFAEPVEPSEPTPGTPDAGAAPVSEPAVPAAGETHDLPPNMQEAFNKRLGAERAKLEKELRAQLEADVKKQYDSHIKLGEMLRQQGYDPGAVYSEYEKSQQAHQAQQAGLSPDVYAKLQAMEQQVQTLQQERVLASLQSEAKTLQAEFGATFDQHAQAAIDRASRTGETLEESFFALGRRDILKAQQAAAEQRVLAQVTGRDGKAPVNATGGPQVTPDNDVRKMPKAEFEKLKQEVLAGKRTSL
jgi:hypothetical protein